MLWRLVQEDDLGASIREKENWFTKGDGQRTYLQGSDDQTQSKSLSLCVPFSQSTVSESRNSTDTVIREVSVPNLCVTLGE